MALNFESFEIKGTKLFLSQLDLPRSLHYHTMNHKDSFPDADFLTYKDESESQATSVPSEFKVKEMKGLLKPEPLLISDKTRFVLFPIKHNDVNHSTR